MELIFVPKGTTTANNGNITVDKDFYIGKYEVTQAEWQTVMTGNTNGIPATPSYFSGKPNNPVEMVSWYYTIVFCNIKSIKEGLVPVYSINGSTNPDSWGAVPTVDNPTWNAATVKSSANGYRVPTEIEWEYAARGGADGTGFLYAGSNNIYDVAWWTVNSDYKAHTVGTKLPNELGIYDMSGNVMEGIWEWDLDYGPSHRYVKGGGAFSPDYGCKVGRDSRLRRTAYYRSSVIGLRVCCSSISSPPSFISLSIYTITHDSAYWEAKTDKDANIYYKTMLRNATAPTSEELVLDYDGFMMVNGYNSAFGLISGLTPDTAYDLFIVLEDSTGNLQSEPTKIEFTTLSDIPNFIDNTPVITIVGETNVVYNICSDKHINAYYIVRKKTDTLLTPDELRELSDGSIFTYMEVYENEIAIIYQEELAKSTDYEIQIVLQNYNTETMQPTVTKLYFKTLGDLIKHTRTKDIYYGDDKLIVNIKEKEVIKPKTTFVLNDANFSID